ncbi:hypothetical protein [Nocardia stercoris]|uniref:Acyl carrier protein n=1 Tax=Nocardia stercoris TaxID=2483361 RepID=A0A3M2KYU8_9NOCA|nr:hypothetical protein [Nocardia stercoris]RMI29443.1 hypothetical protein EBN03_25505 [Nocardia stercoris]
MTDSGSAIRAELRAWVLSKAPDLPADELSDTTPLFERRYIRSIHVPELLLLLERLRGASIDIDDLRPTDFRDIDTLVTRFGTAERAR